MLAASIQLDAQVAAEFQERLLGPQLAHIHQLVRRAGATDPAHAAELLLSPIFYRWFMRLPQFDADELTQHVGRVMSSALADDAADR